MVQPITIIPAPSLPRLPNRPITETYPRYLELIGAVFRKLLEDACDPVPDPPVIADDDPRAADRRKAYRRIVRTHEDALTDIGRMTGHPQDYPFLRCLAFVTGRPTEALAAQLAQTAHLDPATLAD